MEERERVLLKEEIKELKEKIGMMELTKEVDLLNAREVNKVRRLLVGSEKEERKNNIVIKGIDKIDDIKDVKE